jgi:tetratricopeptide (TPR) repeat protein
MNIMNFQFLRLSRSKVIPLIIFFLSATFSRASGASLQEKGLWADAMSALRGEEFVDARDAFAQLRRRYPRSALMKLYWAIAQTDVEPDDPTLGDVLEQITHTLKANPKGYFYLGKHHLRQQRYGEAVEALEHALALRSTLERGFFLLGQAYEGLGDWSKAIDAFGRDQRGGEGRIAILAALARNYERTKRYADAANALQAIADEHPTVAYHHYSLAQFYERRGRRGRARRLYALAKSLEPQTTREMRPLQSSD